MHELRIRGVLGNNAGVGSLVVVTGPPGAGKSIVARILADRAERSVLVEGDVFFGFLRRGAIKPWLPESHRQNDVVTRAAASAAGRYASGSYATVYDGVVGPWYLQTFAAATDLTQFEYVILMPSVERCLEQVATRRGHSFNDASATRHMHAEFARADVDGRHMLFDPPGRPEEVADVVEAGCRNGLFTYMCPPSQ